MEYYNKYHESLDIDCGCGETPKPKKSSNCCGGISLPSHDNDVEVLIKQLKREVKELMNKTQSRLLCQDKKITETMVYIKNNLSNYLRDLFDSMLQSGEINEIINDVIIQSNIGFKTYYNIDYDSEDITFINAYDYNTQMFVIRNLNNKNLVLKYNNLNEEIITLIIPANTSKLIYSDGNIWNLVD